MNLGIGSKQYEARTVERCGTENGCCALGVLEAACDIRNGKSMLETVILQAGHEGIFYPKFYCELNYIGYYWAALKRYSREHCKYSYSRVREDSIGGYDSVDIKTIRRLQNVVRDG